MVTVAARLVVDEAAVLAAVANVPDPEIPVVPLMELGIIRGVQQEPAALLITPTYTGCPATVAIEQLLREALDEAGFEGVAIRSRLSPPWTTDWITPRGHALLHSYGISPPSPDRTATCPRCRSDATVEVSRFGSTPCKAQWRCTDCLEPFDRFKCH